MLLQQARRHVALGTLLHILQDNSAPVGTRVRAAEIVLAQSDRTERENVEAGIAPLERAAPSAATGVVKNAEPEAGLGDGWGNVLVTGETNPGTGQPDQKQPMLALPTEAERRFPSANVLRRELAGAA